MSITGNRDVGRIYSVVIDDVINNCRGDFEASVSSGAGRGVRHYQY
jgi:hypothetical protein